MKSAARFHLAALLAGSLLLAGCSGDAAPSASTNPNTTPDASDSASSPASPSPTSTLTAEEQQAFDAATEAIRAYEQMFYDILADPQPNLNDMNTVAAQPQVALDLTNLQSILAKGGFAIQSAGQTIVLSSEL
ncbi:MAG TPA: hypothetical protein VES03_06985, partial [Motilibacterales bacterium]|nr:hypothetical protein [Motilibacterales bacterium]